MMMNWRSWTVAVVLSCCTIWQTGCAYLTGKEKQPQAGFPSPSATIAKSAAKNPESPNSPGTWSGALFRLTSNFQPRRDKAEKPAVKSPARQPSTNPEIVAGLASVKTFADAGQLDRARTECEQLLARHRQNPQIEHRLGCIADLQGKHDEAEQLFLSALKNQGPDPELLDDLGYCYFLQNKLPKAEAACHKAVKLDPTNKLFRNNYGLVLGMMKRYDEALQQFSSVGSEAEANFNLAFIYSTQERTEEAKECFRKALAADPNFQKAREALAAFEKFDHLPAEQQLAQSNRAGEKNRWVPYIEGGSSSDVQPASATSETPAGRGANNQSANRQAGRATRALFEQSRGETSRNMASQRSGESSSR